MSISPRKKRSDVDTEEKDQTKLDWRLYFGEEGADEMLVDFRLRAYSHLTTDIKAEKERILEDRRIKLMDSGDLILFFKFEVEQGREKEAIEFFEKGLDQDEENHNISELQKIFKRPKSAGKIELIESKGEVIVVYNLYKEYLTEVADYFEKTRESKFCVDFQIEYEMKGSSVQNKKSFTSIKADYITLQMKSESMKASEILNWAQKIDFIQEYEVEQLNALEAAVLIPNLEEFKLSVKFNSLRRMIQYYNYAVHKQGSDVEKQIERQERDYERALPLVNKGIFKERVDATILYSDKLIVDGSMRYKSEEVFLRFTAAVLRLVEDIDQG